jgi:hypothetical protein
MLAWRGGSWSPFGDHSGDIRRALPGLIIRFQGKGPDMVPAMAVLTLRLEDRGHVLGEGRRLLLPSRFLAVARGRHQPSDPGGQSQTHQPRQSRGSPDDSESHHDGSSGARRSDLGPVDLDRGDLRAQPEHLQASSARGSRIRFGGVPRRPVVGRSQDRVREASRHASKMGLNVQFLRNSAYNAADSAR